MKKRLVMFLTLAAMLGLAGSAPAADDCQALMAREQANKAAAMEFFQCLIGDRDYEAARKYVDGFIQHDPKVPDGIEPLIEFLETNPRFKNRPNRKLEFHNVIADGDLVCFQLRNEIKAPDDGSPARMLVEHSFRFNREGKIVEHWSASAMVKLSKTKSKHPLF